MYRLLLLLALASLAAAVEEVRRPSLRHRPMKYDGMICFCNQAECVSDGYLCKSKGLGCYSDLVDDQDFSKSQHGCIDLLPKERERRCQNVPGAGRGPRGSLLLCCHQDMCNHVDSPETRSKYNETLLAIRSQWRVAEESERLELPEQDAAWFKAATVAVPICGALILLILIVLAVKILRTDPQPLPPKLRVGGSGRQMMPVDNPHMDADSGTKKLPLLYQHNDCGPHAAPGNLRPVHLQEKNEANAKLNSPNNILDLHKSSQRAPCNLYQPLIPSPQENQNMYNKAFLIDWGSTIPHS